VITSATGAAVRDVLSVLSRRWPLADVEVLPVPVQGREAPPAIVKMLNKASASGRYDVLLLTRGGGSLEDLWAFNDEAVARAIHTSAVPVVSAVGHEIDFSIADFVADLRAPTPSAAAELLVPDAVATIRHLQQLQQRLLTLQQRKLQAHSQRVDHLFARLQAQRPQARLARDRERLIHLQRRLTGRAARTKPATTDATRTPAQSPARPTSAHATAAACTSTGRTGSALAPRDRTRSNASRHPSAIPVARSMR
jgi:exodeoxyribonuclease VII large subunit